MLPCKYGKFKLSLEPVTAIQIANSPWRIRYLHVEGDVAF